MSTNTASRNHNLPSNVNFGSMPFDLRWIPLLLLIGSLAVRLINITAAPVIGDEYGSLTEAKDFTNYNGILYFVFMHFWNGLGASTLWYRLPSAIFGALAVVVFWDWLRRIRSIPLASVAAVLFMLAPFAIEQGQSIRFYSLFMLTSVSFVWVYWWFINAERKTIAGWGLLAFTTLLLLGSQFMGILVLGAAVLHAILITFNSRRQRIIIFSLLGIGMAALVLVLLSPALLERGYLLIRSLSASPQYTEYQGGRGFSIVTVGKLGILYLSFTLGTAVYPFDLLITLPAFGLFGLLLLFGLYRLSKLSWNYSSFMLILIIGSTVGLYFVFDSLWPTESRDSATPRYIVFMLPFFLALVAEGIVAIRFRTFRWLSFLLVAIFQLYGVYNFLNPSWSINPRRLELPIILGQIDEFRKNNPTVIMGDGRIAAATKYYLDENAMNQVLYSLSEHPDQLATVIADNASIAFLNGDDREEMLCRYNPVLRAVSSVEYETFAWVNFPTFVYIFDRNPDAAAESDKYRLRMPFALYSRALSDLSLPQDADWNGNNYRISGAYYLPTCDGQDTFTVPNSQNEAGKLVLLSNLLGAEDVSVDTTVAELIAVSGSEQTIYPVRLGHETHRWDAAACGDNCSSALDWHKRIAMVGASAYPGAYRDFTAQIWGTEFNIPASSDEFIIRLVDPSVEFYVWGMFVTP